MISIEELEGIQDNVHNIAKDYGFDAASVAWTPDAEVRKDVERLLGFAQDHAELGFKTLSGLDLSGEEPFNLSTARFEDIDMKDLKLPKGTDLSKAIFEGCNVYGVNFNDCKTGE